MSLLAGVHARRRCGAPQLVWDDRASLEKRGLFGAAALTLSPGLDRARPARRDARRQ